MAGEANNLPRILPVGTGVVVCQEVGQFCGMVGKIFYSPADEEHSYRVRLVDGEELSLKRGDFEVLKRYQQEAIMCFGR